MKEFELTQEEAEEIARQVEEIFESLDCCQLAANAVAVRPYLKLLGLAQRQAP